MSTLDYSYSEVPIMIKENKWNLVGIAILVAWGWYASTHSLDKLEIQEVSPVIKVQIEPDRETIDEGKSEPLDPFVHEMSEEERISNITQNACLKPLCPSGSAPAYIDGDLVGYTDEDGSNTVFKPGDRFKHL